MIFSKEALRRGLAHRSSGKQLEQQGTQYACRDIPLPTGLSDALEHVNAGAGPLRSGSPLAMLAIGLAVVAGPGCASVADHDPDVGNRNASLVDKDDA
jgi:hypothetical protein